MADFIHSLNPLYSLSGLFVGALVGFTGVGGGSLMTPLLILLFGVAPTTAVGTDLLYAAVTKCNGTFVHALNGTVDWRITRRLAMGSVPATLVTLVVLWLSGAAKGHPVHGIITVSLGVALLLTAAAIFFRAAALRLLALYTDALSDEQTGHLTTALGAFLGALVTISSVGIGAIGMTALLALYPRLPTVRLVGSDIAHAVPLTFIAGGGYALMGGVDWSLLLSLLIGSLPGVALGGHFAAKAPDRILRFALGGVLALVGLKLIF